MPPSAGKCENEDWEKKYAPKVTRKRLTVGIGIYVFWLAFLAALAAQRWLGTVQ